MSASAVMTKSPNELIAEHRKKHQVSECKVTFITPGSYREYLQSGDEFDLEFFSTAVNSTSYELIEDMTKAGIDWRTYSGRGMYGKYVAAVVTDDVAEIGRYTCLPLQSDSMGKRVVLYA